MILCYKIKYLKSFQSAILVYKHERIAESFSKILKPKKAKLKKKLPPSPQNKNV